MLNRDALVFVAFALLPPALAGAQWEIRNNLNEEFTVAVWPQADDKTQSWVKLRPGETKPVKLGKDLHVIQLISASGDAYLLSASKLSGRDRTLLKTILTPAGRRNGRMVYEYMNQDDLDEDDNADDVRELSRSVWTTEFLGPDDKENVKAKLTFQGDKGKYVTDGFTGNLSRVRFKSSSETGLVAVDGQWTVGEQKGAFEFQINGDQDRLDGRWNADGQDKWRPWTGTRNQD